MEVRVFLPHLHNNYKNDCVYIKTKPNKKDE